MLHLPSHLSIATANLLTTLTARSLILNLMMINKTVQPHMRGTAFQIHVLTTMMDRLDMLHLNTKYVSVLREESSILTAQSRALI
jgi:hypothetical protein